MQRDALGIALLGDALLGRLVEAVAGGVLLRNGAAQRVIGRNGRRGLLLRGCLRRGGRFFLRGVEAEKIVRHLRTAGQQKRCGNGGNGSNGGTHGDAE